MVSRIELAGDRVYKTLIYLAVALLVPATCVFAQDTESEGVRVSSVEDALGRANMFTGFDTQSDYKTPRLELVSLVEVFRDSAVRLKPNPIDSTRAWVVVYEDLRLDFDQGAGGLMTDGQVVKSYSVAIDTETGRLLRVDGWSDHGGDSCCQASAESSGALKTLWGGVESLSQSAESPVVAFSKALAATRCIQPSQAKEITGYLVEFSGPKVPEPTLCWLIESRCAHRFGRMPQQDMPDPLGNVIQHIVVSLAVTDATSGQVYYSEHTLREVSPAR
jgi:hypothetical protein